MIELRGRVSRSQFKNEMEVINLLLQPFSLEVKKRSNKWVHRLISFFLLCVLMLTSYWTAADIAVRLIGATLGLVEAVFVAIVAAVVVTLVPLRVLAKVVVTVTRFVTTAFSRAATSLCVLWHGGPLLHRWLEVADKLHAHFATINNEEWEENGVSWRLTYNVPPGRYNPVIEEACIEIGLARYLQRDVDEMDEPERYTGPDTRAKRRRSGFQHETNTFSPQPGDWAQFAQADSWPALTVGPPLVAGVPERNRFTGFKHSDGTSGGSDATSKPFPLAANIPLSGFMKAVADDDDDNDTDTHGGVQLAPLAWSSACPCGVVTADAYERMCALLCGRLKEMVGDAAAGAALDGVYLDLHGAMVSAEFDDGEGELLRRVRAIIGPSVPLVVSLDLHANVSHGMVARADATLAYRTYPHVDMADTGARAYRLLVRMARAQRLAAGAGDRPPRRRLAVALRKPPFLIPITSMVSAMEPNRSLYALLDQAEAEARGPDADALASASFTPGFGLADCEDCGPAVFVYGPDEGRVNAAADRLYDAVCAQEAAFLGSLLAPADAVPAAVKKALADRRAAKGAGPVILADAQDNPGCGATCDTVGLLNAMLNYAGSSAVGDDAGGSQPVRLSMGLLCDGPAAAAAHAAGAGAMLTGVPVGAASHWGQQAPVDVDWSVVALSNGEVEATGPFYGGSTLSLGRCALLEKRSDQSGAVVSVIVCTKKCQAADMEMFEHLGLQLKQEHVVGVKSAVHFRAHFDGISREIWVVAAPGAAPCDHTNLVYHRVRDGVRKMPLLI